MTGGGEYSDFVASFFPEQQCCCGHPMIFSAAVAPFVLLGSIILISAAAVPIRRLSLFLVGTRKTARQKSKITWLWAVCCGIYDVWSAALDFRREPTSFTLSLTYPVRLQNHEDAITARWAA